MAQANYVPIALRPQITGAKAKSSTNPIQLHYARLFISVVRHAALIKALPCSVEACRGGALQIAQAVAGSAP
jgi:hypothetical protein